MQNGKCCTQGGSAERRLASRLSGESLARRMIVIKMATISLALQVGRHRIGRQQAGYADETEPESGFAGFLEGDTHFRDEVPLRLATGGFLEVRANRRTGIKQLGRNLPRGATRFSKPSIQFHHPAAKAKRALVDVRTIHACLSNQNACRPKSPEIAAQSD